MLRVINYSAFLVVFIMVAINVIEQGLGYGGDTGEIIVYGILAIIGAEIFTRILLRIDKK